MSVDVLIRQLQGSVGGKTFRCGSTTLSFPGGSVNSSVRTVTHGLPRTPASIQLTVVATATPADVFVSTGSVGASTFGARGRTTDGSSPPSGTTVTFYWLAIG